MSRAAWLAILQAVSTRHTRPWLEALGRAGSAEALLAEARRSPAALGLGEEAARKLRSPDAALTERAERWLEKPGRALVVHGAPEYPPLLAALPHPPLALFVEGARPALLAAPQLAIVGSRNPTAGGRETAEQFARYLSRHGLTITSGLASGIDGASHRGALHETGGTIAVLGSGLDVIYPREHEGLAREIAANGLLVSEYLPGTVPLPHHFPERNRIIAALALGTLVVEATRKSGSLHTAQNAADLGREVFAIPGSIHNPLARGCHALIRQGAKLVEEAADIFVELAPLLQLELEAAEAVEDERVQTRAHADPAYAALLECMDFAPVPIAELVKRSGLTPAELSSMLLMLELEGLVEASPGGRYTRLRKSSCS